MNLFQAVLDFPIENYNIYKTNNQGDFYIDSKDDLIKSILVDGFVWEPYLIPIFSRCVKIGATVLDIGAHIGVHTILLSRLVGESGQVIAFEPQKKIYSELCMNLALNGCSNALPLSIALGNERGTLYLGEQNALNEGGRAISSQKKIEPIEMVKLDDLMLENISMIKIDVELFELEVLKGAYETIMKSRPVVLVEIGGGMTRGIEEGIDPSRHLQDVLKYFEEVLNYKIEQIFRKDYLALPN